MQGFIINLDFYFVRSDIRKLDSKAHTLEPRICTECKYIMQIPDKPGDLRFDPVGHSLG